MNRCIYIFLILLMLSEVFTEEKNKISIHLANKFHQKMYKLCMLENLYLKYHGSLSYSDRTVEMLSDQNFDNYWTVSLNSEEKPSEVIFDIKITKIKKLDSVEVNLNDEKIFIYYKWYDSSRKFKLRHTSDINFLDNENIIKFFKLLDDNRIKKE